ncbi:MAG TPA: hypothetical protein VFN29_07130 [Chiayiivirga sp.]|nr:hypothetical protein [Chiayiivirga sp.]
MKQFGKVVSLLGVLGLFSLPAIAQQESEIAKLQVDSGVIMTSRDNAAFVSAVTNDPLFDNQRLMVSEDSSATVVYDDGCRETYDKPGVYELDATCTPALVSSSEGMSPGLTAAAGVAGVVLAAYLVDRNNDDETPPVSR